jgi:hypothetical protein
VIIAFLSKDVLDANIEHFFSIWRFGMKDRIIHQWRDWVLEYIEDGTYELIHKENQAARRILAKTDMDAENICQQIIKDSKEEQEPAEPQQPDIPEM